MVMTGKQDRIDGNPVADGWAGAVMRKPLGIQKCCRRTDGPTETTRCRVACPRLKIKTTENESEKKNNLLMINGGLDLKEC